MFAPCRTGPLFCRKTSWGKLAKWFMPDDVFFFFDAIPHTRIARPEDGVAPTDEGVPLPME